MLFPINEYLKICNTQNLTPCSSCGALFPFYLQGTFEVYQFILSTIYEARNSKEKVIRLYQYL